MKKILKASIIDLINTEFQTPRGTPAIYAVCTIYYWADTPDSPTISFHLGLLTMN